MRRSRRRTLKKSRKYKKLRRTLGRYRKSVRRSRRTSRKSVRRSRKSLRRSRKNTRRNKPLKRKRSLRRRNNQKNKEIVGGVNVIHLGAFMTFLAAMSVGAAAAPLALGVAAATFVRDTGLKEVNPVELAEAAQAELEKKATGEGEGSGGEGEDEVDEVDEVESEGKARAEDEDELPDFNPGERIEELNGLVALTDAETRLVGSINDRCRQLTANPDNPRINVICNAWLSQIRLQMIGVMGELQKMEEEGDIAELMEEEGDMAKLMAETGRTLPPEATKYLGDSSVSDTFSAAVVMLDGIIEETTTRETTQDRRLQEEDPALGAPALGAPAAEAEAEAAATEPLPLPQRCAMIEGGHFFGSSEAFEMACAEERKTKPPSECSIWTLPTAELFTIAAWIFGLISGIVSFLNRRRSQKESQALVETAVADTRKHQETVEAHAKSTAAEIKGARQDNVEMFDLLQYNMERHNKRLTREARRKNRRVRPDSGTAYPDDLTRMGSAPPPPPPPATVLPRRTLSTGSAAETELSTLRSERMVAAQAQVEAQDAFVRGIRMNPKKNSPPKTKSGPLTPPPTPSPRSGTKPGRAPVRKGNKTRE